jgi:hypothetical protein
VRSEGFSEMARTPNYNQQRAERNRAKQAKKDAKLREREEAVARRKADRDEPAESSSAAVPAAGNETNQS